MGERCRTTHVATRIPAIDGLRAIAVLAVLVFHASPGWLPGGFTGVDVFFVISGFVITRSILHEHATQSFSLSRFYLKRIHRLLPAAFVMLLVVLLLWSLTLPASMLRQAARHTLWVLGYASNFYAWRMLGGYWTNRAEAMPLTHTWSLAVEEQFYLLFPIAMMMLLRLSPRMLGRWLAVAAVISFVASLALADRSTIAVFYLLPSRAWQLLLGALTLLAVSRVSVLRHVISDHAWNLAGWIGLATAVAGFVAIREAALAQTALALLPTLASSVMLLSFTQATGSLTRALSLPAAQFIGQRAYAIYLWHWPLIIFGRLMADLTGFSHPLLSWLGAGLSIGLACLSHAWVERPLLLTQGRRSRLPAIAGAGVLIALIALWQGNRPVVADPLGRFDPLIIHESFDAGPIDSDSTRSEAFADVVLPPRQPEHRDAWRRGGIQRAYGGSSPRIVVFGSSHGLMYSHLIDALCRELGVSVAFLSVGEGTPAFLETRPNPALPTQALAEEFDAARRQYLREWRPDVLIVIDRWDSRFARPEPFEQRLRTFLLEVSPLVGTVLFITQAPAIDNAAFWNLRELANWRVATDGMLPRFLPDEREALRKQSVRIATEATAEFSNLRVVRADLSFYHPDGSVRYADGRSFFYIDDDHLSEIGTQQARVIFRDAIQIALNAAPK